MPAAPDTDPTVLITRADAAIAEAERLVVVNEHYQREVRENLARMVEAEIEFRRTWAGSLIRPVRRELVELAAAILARGR
jgi:hypothetical protein